MSVQPLIYEEIEMLLKKYYIVFVLLFIPAYSCSSSEVANSCKQFQMNCLTKNWCISAQNNGTSSG